MKAQDYNISSEKFVFRADNKKLHDTKLETKPVSYFQDALHRFTRNKASIVAAIIIAILVLFAIIAPMLSPYTVAYEDANYAFARPKNQLFYDLGIPFWDGGTEKEVSQAAYDGYRGIEQELGVKLFMSEIETREETYMGKTKTLYTFRLDTYNAVGVTFELLTTQQYNDLQKYQDEKGIQVILPITDPDLPKQYRTKQTETSGTRPRLVREAKQRSSSTRRTDLLSRSIRQTTARTATPARCTGKASRSSTITQSPCPVECGTFA